MMEETSPTTISAKLATSLRESLVKSDSQYRRRPITKHPKTKSVSKIGL
jgi:hypothetical protein